MSLWVELGDTGFTRSDTLLGGLIRWGEEHQGDPNAWANHTFVVVESGWLVPPEKYGYGLMRDEEHFNYDAEGRISPKIASVIEALWHVRKGPLKVNGVEVRVFRPVPPFNAEQAALFIAEAETYVGDKYGWWKLLFQLGDRAIFGGKKVLTRFLFVKDRPICSFLAAKVNALVGCYFGVPPQCADPDTMMDYALAHPEKWQEVGVADKTLAKAS